MLLPIQDALLLCLVVGSMGALLLGELPGYWNDLRKIYAGWATRARHPEAPALPSARPPGKVAVRAAPAALAPLPQIADLLLVDDSAVARAKLRRLFEASGYTVQLACDGVEALALLGQGCYGMMITDLEMPNMDGVTLINTCLGQPATARMPIIAVSAHENLRAKFNECRNICGVHRKPWADDILLSHVAMQIGTRRVRVPALA